MRRSCGTTAALFGTLVVATATACGDDGEDGTSSSATTAPAASETVEETATEATPAVSTIDAATAPAIPLADVQEAELELASPDYLAELDGAVWVKLDGGDVVELDPATAKQLQSLDLNLDQDDLCQGLGTGGGYVWSCTASDVLRIDPATAKIVDTIPGVKIRDQGLMPFAEGRIWVLSGNADQLVGIDAATAQPGDPIALPTTCGDVGPGEGSTLWVVCGLQNAVLQVDVDAGTVVNRLELPSPTIAWGTATDVWVGDSDGLVRIGLASMQPVAVFDGLNPDLSGDLMISGDDVWVRSAAGFLHRIDAATNAVVAHVEPPEAVSGGSVLATDDAVWVTEYDDNVVLQLKPDA